MTLLALTTQYRDTCRIGFLLWIWLDSLSFIYYFVLMHFLTLCMHTIKNQIFIKKKKKGMKKGTEWVYLGMRRMPLRLQGRMLWGYRTLNAVVGSSWFLKAKGWHAGLSIFIKHGIHKGVSQPRNTGGFGCFPTHLDFLFIQHWGIYSACSFSDFVMGVNNIIPDVVDCLTVPEVQMEKGQKRHQRHSNAIPGMWMN